MHANFLPENVYRSLFIKSWRIIYIYFEKGKSLQKGFEVHGGERSG